MVVATSKSTPYPIARSALVALPQPLVEYVKRDIERYRDRPEFRDRRKYVRFPMSMEVPVVPLTMSNLVSGQTFLAMLRDVSAGGICLYMQRFLLEKRIAVEIDAASFRKQMICDVVRCVPSSRFYECGCRLVHKIDLPS